MKLRDYIKSDLSVLPGSGTALINLIKWYFFGKGEVYPLTFWLRITWYIRKKYGKLISFVPYIFMRHYEYKYGIHPNANIPIGKALHIVHGDGVYLNCESIGDHFTVYQGVTLGKGKGGLPKIGNNVTVFTNAVVVGNITIHDGARIGANCYVDKDVQENETIMPPKCD